MDESTGHLLGVVLNPLGIGYILFDFVRSSNLHANVVDPQAIRHFIPSMFFIVIIRVIYARPIFKHWYILAVWFKHCHLIFNNLILSFSVWISLFPRFISRFISQNSWSVFPNILHTVFPSNFLDFILKILILYSLFADFECWLMLKIWISTSTGYLIYTKLQICLSLLDK